MRWYRRTIHKTEIVKDKLRKNYGRFGTGVYFSNNYDFWGRYGENLELKNIEDYDVEEIYYPDLIKIYPLLSIDEEEGITELEGYIVDNLGKDGVIIEYICGEKEMCIYRDLEVDEIII